MRTVGSISSIARGLLKDQKRGQVNVITATTLKRGLRLNFSRTIEKIYAGYLETRVKLHGNIWNHVREYQFPHNTSRVYQR